MERPVALLRGGGTQFFTFRGSDRQWSSINNLLTILSHPKRLARTPMSASRLLLRRLRTARLHSVCWRGAIGVGVGPFRESNKDMELQLAVLRSMGWLAMRDQESLDICYQYGIWRAFLGADLAFLYPQIDKTLTRHGKIVVIPRVLPVDHDWKDWENTLCGVLEVLPPDSIEIVSVCVIDHAMATDLAARLKLRLTCWDPDAMSLESMIEHLSSAQSVVSARYHGALVSAAAGVPTLVIGLDQKLESLGYQLNNITSLRKPVELVYWVRRASQGKLECGENVLGVAINELRKRAEKSVQALIEELQKLDAGD